MVFSSMTSKRHLYMLKLGPLLRGYFPVDDRLPLSIRLALCHLTRAEAELLQDEN